MKEITKEELDTFNNYYKYGETNSEIYKKIVDHTIKKTFNNKIRLLYGCKTFVNTRNTPTEFEEIIDIFVGGSKPQASLKFVNGMITMDDYAETMYEIHHFELNKTT